MTATRVVFFVVLAVYSALYVARGARDPGAADGFYSYLYARSLAFDGDLDFKNDYAACGDPFAQGVDRGTGRVDNPGHPGPAIVWTPLVWVARLVLPLSSADPDVRLGCLGPIARAALLSSVPLGALAIALSFACARRFVRDGIAATAALLFAFASSLPQYAAVFVSSSHVHECAAAALLLWLTLRATDARVDDPSPSRRAWALVGVGAALAALSRLSNLSLLIVPLALLATSNATPRERLLRGAWVVLGGALGAALLLALYTHLYGSPFVLPQGRHYLHLAHAHPWLLLFAPHGGLFFTTPIAYLAVAGIVVAARRPEQRALAIAASVAVAAIVFVASAPLDWHGKATFGARRLVVLTPLFVVLAAIALGAAAPWIDRHVKRLLATAVILLLGIPVVGGVMGTTTGETSLHGGSQADVYGGGTRALFAAFDRGVGDLAILPAEAFYALRFGLPMRTFRAATTDRHYRRSYRDLSWEPNTLDFQDATLRAASSGVVPDARGVRLTSAAAKVVFAAGWPVATDARLEIEADGASGANGSGSVALGVGTTFRRCDLGERAIAAGSSVVSFTIPDGCFGSGLVELRVRGAPGLLLVKLVLDDTRALPPPY